MLREHAELFRRQFIDRQFEKLAALVGGEKQTLVVRTPFDAAKASFQCARCWQDFFKGAGLGVDQIDIRVAWRAVLQGRDALIAMAEKKVAPATAGQFSQARSDVGLLRIEQAQSGHHAVALAAGRRLVQRHRCNQQLRSAARPGRAAALVRR